MQKARPARGTRKRNNTPRRKEAGAASIDLLSPGPDNAFYVYVAGKSRRGVLKAGATGNLASIAPLRLLWYERLDDIPAALALAERIERWPRIWKLQMIDRTNPAWDDLVVAVKSGPPPRAS
jgi:putative endonuclease